MKLFECTLISQFERIVYLSGHIIVLALNRAGNNARGAGSCNNCESLKEMIANMVEKMDQRFNQVETCLKEENAKLREQLVKAEKKYSDVCGKVQEMAIQSRLIG